jgi:hypothetical protein
VATIAGGSVEVYAGSDIAHPVSYFNVSVPTLYTFDLENTSATIPASSGSASYNFASGAVLFENYSYQGGSFAINNSLGAANYSGIGIITNFQFSLSVDYQGNITDLLSVNLGQGSSASDTSFTGDIDNIDYTSAHTTTNVSSVTDLSVSGLLTYGNELSNYSGSNSLSINSTEPAGYIELLLNSQYQGCGGRGVDYATCDANSDAFGISSTYESPMFDGDTIAAVLDLPEVATDIELPLPEPATWALILLGLTGIGAALRTNRRLSAASIESGLRLERDRLRSGQA